MKQFRLGLQGTDKQIRRENNSKVNRRGLEIATQLMIVILESHPDKVIPHHSPSPYPPHNQMSTVQLVGLRQKGVRVCVCGEGGGGCGGGGGGEWAEGWREIIACWCICVAGGSGVE